MASLTQEQRALDSHDAVGARTTAAQLVQAINNIKSDEIDKKQAKGAHRCRTGAAERSRPPMTSASIPPM